MQRSTFRLSWPLKAVVYLSFLALLVTGALWMYVQPHLEDDAWQAWDKFPRLMMKIHGGAAMVALLVLGAVTLHIKRGWKAKKNRLSGVLLIALCVFLILTGYGLYYAGDEDLRNWLSRWHGWIGLGTFVILPGHVVAGRLIIRRWHLRKLRAMPQRPSPAHPHLP